MNNKFIIGVILALIVGIAAGYYFGYDQGWEEALAEHAHEEMAGEHGDGTAMTHEHEQMEAPSPFPSVDLVVHKDPKSGWNAQILLTNFSFAPESVSTVDTAGEGHAHIYIDGVKINRVYGEWYHLGELAPGIHDVSVRLSTNDHKELLRGGALIMDHETVEVSGNDSMMQMEQN